MSAITAPFNDERVRLWTGSAFTVLLAHLAVAVLLLLHVHAQQPVLRGTAEALDVEIAGPLSSLAAPSAAVAQVQQQPTRPLPQPQVAAVHPVKPLPQLQPIAQQTELRPPLSVAPAAAASATLAATEASAPAVQDLTVSDRTLGQPDAPPSPQEQWLAQVIARLERYKSYPRSAAERHQQDTVTLQLTVNHAGQVVSSSVSSQHHYRVLENEAREMLRLAGPLPALPQQLSASQIVLHVPIDFYLLTRKPPSVAASCARPVDPGAAPPGAEVTLAQMQAYRGRLKQYLAAARSELDCLGGGSGAAALAARNAAVSQMQGFADRFNAQARAFQAKAQAQALQAQQARQRQAQALAAQVYAACTRPPDSRAPGTLTAEGAPSFRRQLIRDQSAVRAYVACLRQADLAATTPARGLASDQRAQLDQTAVHLGNAAVLSFNQVVGGFNAQVPHLRLALAAQAQQNLAEVLVRATAIFPNSTWNVPAPLPADECIRIVRTDQTYQAQLCESNYVTKVGRGPVVFSKEHNANPGVAILIANGDSVDFQAPKFGSERLAEALVTSASSSLPETQMTSYIISDLQVSGTHLILTIDRKSNVALASKADNWSSVHFDLALSTDGRRLVGQCWTAQKRWDCQLSRHP